MENNVVELKCYCCRSHYKENDIFCGACGYPLNGSPEEQKQYSIQFTLNKIDKENAQSKVSEARIVLFALSIFTLISCVVGYLGNASGVLLAINIILACIYAGLGFWASKKAFAAIFTGGLIYITIILLNGIFDPVTILQGIIFKVIFVVGFIKAAYSAYKFKIDKV